MTRLRRQRPFWRLSLCVTLVTAALMAGLWQGASVQAQTAEPIVVDRDSGLAIHGFDPVAFFTEGKAIAGRDDVGLEHGGAAWRFSSEENRTAFAARPEAYIPSYGGHDPLSIARAVVRPGHPEFFAIHDKKLFLFNSEGAKAEFEISPKVAIQMADTAWPMMRETLAP
jgi:hypothetical protein